MRPLQSELLPSGVAGFAGQTGNDSDNDNDCESSTPF
jgi:hypothetical protein